MSHQLPTRFFLASAVLCLLSAAAPACSVPVFRYALEKWPADPYGLTIVHRGALDASQKAIVEALKDAADNAANFDVRDVDLAAPAEVSEAIRTAGKGDLPALVLQYPAAYRVETPVWTGPLTAANAAMIVNSPARRELANRLLNGDSVVWILLDSGKADEDAKAGKMLQEQSDKLEKELKLPERDPTDPAMAGDVALKLKFSILHVSRTDPTERVFVAMLLHISEPCAKAPGPVLYPCFGRGRILAGLCNDDINPDVVGQAAAFLTGECSCEIKGRNPGVDALLAADWDALPEGRIVQDPPVPALIGMSQFLAATQPATLPASRPATQPALASAAGGAGPLARNLVIVLIAGIFVLVIGSVMMRKQRGRN